MKRYVIRRAGLSMLTLGVVITATFFVLRLVGDPAAAIAGEGAPQAAIAKVRHDFGFDRPIMVQYGDFLKGLVHGDLGVTQYYKAPVLDVIGQRIPYTLELAAAALALSVIVAVIGGSLAAARRGSRLDKTILAICAAGQSIPHFVLGPILIFVFAVTVNWLPVSGASSPSALVLPAITLASFPATRLMPVLRTSMVEVFQVQFVQAARARGLRDSTILSRHVLRNALLPFISVLGLQIVDLLGGAIITETVFGWPGVGSLMRSAIVDSDYQLVLGLVGVFAFAVLVVNLLTDLAYGAADPRIRYR